MQIFSKLQRNSTYYFIIILFSFFVNLLNSNFLFFPLMIGFFLYCKRFFIGFIFILIFSILHNFNIILFVLYFLFYKFSLQKYIHFTFDKKYEDVINLFVIYLFLFFYLIFMALDINFLLIYILYNFSMDILIIRLSRCKVKLFYF